MSKSPIILPANATKATKEAAEELAGYIEKITGNCPDRVNGDPTPTPASAIWIGVQPRVKKLFPDASFDFKNPEEVFIASDGHHVVIAGRDRSVGATQIEYGTANAIYTFLQKYLDVRWLWPGPYGEDIIESNTIELSPFVYRYAPQFRMRDVVMHWVWWWFRNDESRADQIQSWVRRQRLLYDSLELDSGHGFTDWWKKYHDKHPDYFALQPDGTRSGYPRYGYAKLCQSNPRVWAQWLDDVDQKLREHPTTHTFDASPNDSSYSGICVCEKCRAWDNPSGPIQTYYYAHGKRLKYVAMTHRYITFWNHLGRLLKHRYPDREYYISGSAYGPAMPPPTKATLEDNIIIKYVGQFPLTTENSRRNQKAQWRAWARRSSNVVYRPNLWYFGAGGWGFPEVAMTKTIEDWRFLADNHCVGIAVDMNRCYWGLHGPQYYIMAQLTWNPRQDGKLVLKDYYRRGFGPAARDIESYWTMMEKARDKLVGDPDYRTGNAHRFRIPPILGRVYNEDFLKRAEALLIRAASKTANGPEKYARRVDFVRSGFNVMKLLARNIPLMARVRNSRGKDTEAVKQAFKNWRAIERVCKQSEVFSVRMKPAGLKLWLLDNGYMAHMQDYFGPPSKRFRIAAGLE